MKPRSSEILRRFRLSTPLALAVLALLGLQCRPDGTGSTSPRGGTATDAFGSAGFLESLSQGPFKLRAGPKPPRRVGEQMQLSFPPPTKPKKGPGKVQSPPLKVLRGQ